jgi:uncharacterized protein (TIGR00255 family)
MTGFGRCTFERDGREVTVELKSVNHRFLDIGMRLPRHIGFAEDTVRTVLSEQLCRGHIDVFISYKNNRSDSRKVTVDNALLKAYIEAARTANAVLGLLDDLTLTSALRMPDVTDISEAEEDRDAVNALIREALLAACGELKQMRLAEGERLKNDLSARADRIENITREISKRAPAVVDDYRVRLTARIEELLSADVDKQRLATEVALFADRASIDEETVRLFGHAEQFRSILRGAESSGRKLDFLVQEMNREFNTIGSKANDSAIVNLVIEAKAEVEKIREQVQNIE